MADKNFWTEKSQMFLISFKSQKSCDWEGFKRAFKTFLIFQAVSQSAVMLVVLPLLHCVLLCLSSEEDEEEEEETDDDDEVFQHKYYAQRQKITVPSEQITGSKVAPPPPPGHHVLNRPVAGRKLDKNELAYYRLGDTIMCSLQALLQVHCSIQQCDGIVPLTKHAIILPAQIR